jgi:hypothetical protein
MFCLFNSHFFEYTIVDLIGLIVNFIGLIVSIFTLYLAYRIFKSFDVRKNHINKQLETVLNLVQEINDTVFKISDHHKIPQDVLEQMKKSPVSSNYTTTFSSIQSTLWFISDGNPSIHEDSNVFLKTDVKTTMPFLNYMNNPLLPKTIALKLGAFYSPFTDYSNSERASDTYFVIVRIKTGEKMDLSQSYQYPHFAKPFENWGNFIFASKDLKDEILRWLKKYGANDINLSTRVFN